MKKKKKMKKIDEKIDKTPPLSNESFPASRMAVTCRVVLIEARP